MTTILHIHGRDAKGKPSYTKTKVGEPTIEITESDMKTMEQWATEILSAALPTDAMTPNPDPMNSMLAGIPFVAVPEESA